MTSLPSTFRPKKEKGRKTIADYGFTPQMVSENEVVIEAATGDKKFAITILDQTSSGIYACVAEPGENGGTTKAQSVIFSEEEGRERVVESARILARICGMPSNWRK